MSPPVRLTLLVGLALLASAALYVLVFVDVGLPLSVTLTLYRLVYVVVPVLAAGMLVVALMAWRRSRQ